MAVAVAGDRGLLRITARRLCAPGVARARQNFVELAFEHGLQEFTRSIPKASFDRIDQLSKRCSVASISDCGRQGVVISLVMA